MNEICETCRFWVCDEEDETLGQCRRHPPVIPSYKDQGMESEFVGSTARALAIFPKTVLDWWCGEWKIDDDRVTSPPATSEESNNEILSRHIRTLNLSIRACKSLKRELSGFYKPISTVGELVSCTAEDLMERSNFGKTTLQEVREKLSSVGLKLKLD